MLELNKIYNEDCLIALSNMTDNSVDSVVTDPPYGLSFMGKKWDYDVPNVELWREVLRVLKPGGHILVACGTRTQHRMAVNIEDGGFEIRDIISWVYGSGFPKSLNIGKAVDKLQGNKRETYLAPIAYPDSDCWGTPNSNKGSKSTIWQKDGDEIGKGGKVKRTKGTSEWEGWGTALKPAMELWTLARKPLSEKTIAENVLKWGTGGINIDGCRIETDEKLTGGTNSGSAGIWSSKKIQPIKYEQPQGRFPANFIHDGSEEVIGLFPKTKSGFMKKGTPRLMSSNPNKNTYGHFDPDFVENDTYGDSGSAARFFYAAKASKSERDFGLDKFTEQDTRRYGNRGAGELPKQTPQQAVVNRNNHPTVKPLSLMRYLCRLITPPNGICLDPFTGSGTTGIACKLEGFGFIGIEREEEYCKIAEARIEAWKEEKENSNQLEIGFI